MATAELSILEGIMARKNATTSRGEISFGNREWLTDMRHAMRDMEDGLGKNNRDHDKAYHRMKIASVLLAKTLEICPDVAPSAGIEEQFSHLLRLVPELDFDTFFTATYQLNLLPELTELLLATRSELRSYILENMKRWVLDSSDAVAKTQCFSQGLNLFERLLFIISVYITATMISDTTEQTNLLTIITKIVKQFLQNLTEAPVPHINAAEPNRLYEIMIKRLLALIGKRTSTSPLDRLDVLQLTDVSLTLRGNVIASVCGNNTSKTASDLLIKLPGIKRCSSRIANGHCLKEAIKELNDITNNCVQVFEAYSGYAEACELLCAVLEAFGHLAEEDIAPPSHTPTTPLKAIAHHLKGFHEIALGIINDIGENPLEKNWADIFSVLHKNPECLSRSVHLLAILKAISRCQERRDCGADLAEVVLSLQELFWLGFALLPLRPKRELVRSIFTDLKLLSSLSQHPRSGKQGLTTFQMKNTKMLQTTFSSLLSEEAASDTVLSKMCELILRWPEGTIQKIIEQVLKSHHQTELFIDILKNFEYLLTFESDSNHGSVFVRYFHKSLLLCWQSGETESIEHGLEFLSSLLNPDKALDDLASKTFLKEMFFTCVVTSISRNENVTPTKQLQQQVFPDLLGLKVLSCIIGTPCFVECVGFEELMAFCVCLGACVDRSRHFWDSNSDFDLETHELLIECTEYTVTRIACELSESESQKKVGNMSVEWLLRAISPFMWTTRLRFIPIIKLGNKSKISVPASLSEVCRIPDVLNCSEKLSYGAGSGLVAWHQCFVVNPSLCPLSSLDIDDLSQEAAAIFSHGWTITLAQVLPFCLPHEWNTLLEATKVLLSDHKLQFTYDTMFVNVLPVVDMHECYAVLGVAKILQLVSGILAKPCCVHWTSMKMWLHFSKRYCAAVARLVNDSAEFNEADSGSKFFMLSQTFCMACDYMILLAALPVEKQHKNCSENVLVLLLDLVGTYEKILVAISSEEDQDDDAESDHNPGDESSSFDDPSISGKSILSRESATNMTRLCFEVAQQLDFMLQTVAHLPIEEHRVGLNSKLTKLLEIVNEY